MPAGARSADNVVDLLEWRAARRPEELPAAVVDEIEIAARMYEALHTVGHEVRFDLPGEHGGDRVRAELRSVDGDVVRELPLLEVVGVGGPPAPTAA